MSDFDTRVRLAAFTFVSGHSPGSSQPEPVQLLLP
jgi:hypothetical protein